MATATQFYLVRQIPQTDMSRMGPTWNGGPTATICLSPSKLRANNTNAIRSEASAAISRQQIYEAVSFPLGAQTFGGTLDVVIATTESNADADMYWKLYLWVSVGATDVVRGVLLDYEEAAGANEWTTTATGRGFVTPQALAAIACQDGDRLVAEIGYIAYNVLGASRFGTLRHGAQNGGVPSADLSVGSTTVTTQAGFLLFSQPVELGPAPINDACSAPINIPSLPYSGSFDIRYATQEVDDPQATSGGFPDNQTIWWTYTPATSHTAVALLLGDGPISLSVWTGSCGNFVEVDSDAEAFSYNTYPAYVSWAAVAGVSYTLMIAGLDANLFPPTTITLAVYDAANVPTTDGDLYVGNQEIFLYDAGTGALKALIDVAFNDVPSDGAFFDDRFIVTAFGNNFIRHYTPDLASLSSYDVSPGDRPLSITVDQTGVFYVGHVGDAGNTITPAVGTAPSRPVLKFTQVGTLLQTFTPDPDASGPQFVELAADQRTLYYTGMGRLIKRFDVVSGTQLSDFTTLPTETSAGRSALAQGLRFLPDGTLLVCDTIDVKRLDSSGAIIQRYDYPDQKDWYCVDLSPDGTTIWAANTANDTFSEPLIVQFDAASGTVLQTILPYDSGGALCGLTTRNGFRIALTGQTLGVCPPVAWLGPATPGCVAIGEL